LLAVNPYRTIATLFNEELKAEIVENIKKGLLTASPHIYYIAGKAFHSMKNKEPKQSIIISGESGAGKTESTKYCMEMLTKLSAKKSHSIERKILACNPLLEAFGNSKTVRN
jgi:myosin heavy subunit